MGLKEIDQVRMLGVLPSQGADPIPVGKIPDGGTQIIKDGAVADGLQVVHTVTSGKTFYLSTAYGANYNTSGGAGYVQILVTDDEDATQYLLLRLRLAADGSISETMSFLPPLEIPAGYKIKINSDAANVAGYALIHGYEA